MFDAFVRVGLPQRQVSRYLGPEFPNIEGAVFNLYPKSVSQFDLGLWFGTFSCLDQISHQQPIGEDCVNTGQSGIAPRLQHWATARLLEGNTSNVSSTLAQLGFSYIALHSGLFVEGDRLRLGSALQSIDSSPQKIGHLGDSTELYKLSPAQRTDSTTILQSLNESGAIKIGHGYQYQNVRNATESKANSIRFAVVLEPNMHQQRIGLLVENNRQKFNIQLSDDGQLPGDTPNDGIAWGLLEATTTGPLTVTLVRYRSDIPNPSKIWKGGINPTVRNDQFVWQLTKNGAYPIMANPPDSRSNYQPWNGFVALVGWIVTILCMMIHVVLYVILQHDTTHTTRLYT